ncbi:MAG: thiamine pyrophosphate-dependent dehydrogenase E1 component subunit alpha [Deltaproteobacteria bacterium]
METRSLRSVPDAYRGRHEPLDPKHVFELMVKSRALEERLIAMTRSSDGFFWIGGPGEEAFNVPLGLLVNKGEGLDHDFLHLHYRSSAILTAMGMPMIDAIRQMASKATDPHTGGRNFINHFAMKAWNVVPGTSTIETQYAVAPGTALAQKRHGGHGITIVNGGDAGSAEGDFATCLNWSSRPGRELPLLIIVVNNKYGISTPFDQVHGDQFIARRGEAFGIRWDVLNGNDPVESHQKLSEIIAYIREERMPFVLEAYTSRLHGHSSSSGAARVHDEPDCVKDYGEKLVAEGIFTADDIAQLEKKYRDEGLAALEQARSEPDPDPSTIHDHTFA